MVARRPGEPPATGPRRPAPRPWRCRGAGPTRSRRSPPLPSADRCRAGARRSEAGSSSVPSPTSRAGSSTPRRRRTGHLQLGDPLGRRDVSVEPRHHHADREPVVTGSGCPFMPTANMASRPSVRAVGVPHGPPVVRQAHQLVGAGLDAGLASTSGAAPPASGRCRSGAPDLVRHARQGDEALVQRRLEKVVEGRA